ncbi:MAG: hypothetical protein EOP33_03905 [Rickettsiaceae bacterium]|nr:MAG: hypothetical protein EOP33_03905 [Rickettsiaceae bacterium]
MDITPSVSSNINVINGYGISGFKINNCLFTSHIVLSPDMVSNWRITDNAEQIQSTHSYTQVVEIIKQKKTSDILLLIGTGRKSILLSPVVINYFASFGIVPESMSTPAACRTYNVLTSEGRFVCALLLNL